MAVAVAVANHSGGVGVFLRKISKKIGPGRKKKLKNIATRTDISYITLKNQIKYSAENLFFKQGTANVIQEGMPFMGECYGWV